jgi:hypothetical protein
VAQKIPSNKNTKSASKNQSNKKVLYQTGWEQKKNEFHLNPVLTNYFHLNPVLTKSVSDRSNSKILAYTPIA